MPVAPVPPTGMRRISDSRFFVAVNGAGPSPPASGLIDFLLKHRAQRLTTVFHPLEPEHQGQHVITVYEPDTEPTVRRIGLPSRPPWTYAADPFVPLWPESVDVWFGFNNLACARGLLARRLRRCHKVVYWAVDFVPNRFGDNVLTKAYDRLDALCCHYADARFELSAAALRGRNDRLRLKPESTSRAHVVPIGAWVDTVPVTPENGWKSRRVLYVGHLVKRQGVGLLVEALGLLARRDVDFVAEIAGSGPLEAELRKRAEIAGIQERLRFAGFIPDHRGVESFLATGSLAVAAYDPEDNVLTQHADPTKLKDYLAAGLPIVMTELPHNARELEERAGAEIIPFEARALADAIERGLADGEQWQQRRRAALRYAKGFDWQALLEEPLNRLGFAA
jgi:glycosyltransferase involved in cell wall biosynthesis